VRYYLVLLSEVVRTIVENFIDSLKQRYKIVEESISVAKDITGMDIEDVKKDRRLIFALRGALLFYIQGLLDIANYIVISRDMTPMNHKDIFDILLRTGMIDGSYSNILSNLILLRNKLLFVYEKIDLGEIYNFVRENLESLNEIFHLMIKISGLL